MRIIYMGTPEFAIAPLEALLNAGYEIAAVVTAPDKPAGRGKKLQAPPVKQFAEKQGLKILQPEKLRNPGFLDELRSLEAGLQIVVAFRMLPKEVWSMPRLGTFNLHASLLPQYRGAAPINHVIINGEKETGLTTFFIDEEIDTGRILFREKIEIGERETAGELHDRMSEKGAALVVKTARAIESGTVQPLAQDEFAKDQALHPAPKIHKEDTVIHWRDPAPKIFNLIRGLSPYPGALAILEKEGSDKIPVKIYYAEYRTGDHGHAPGTISTDGKSYLDVAAGNGFVRITDLLQGGRKRMKTGEFLRGFPGIAEWRFAV